MSHIIKIGVLAFQGAFAEHEYSLQQAAAILAKDGETVTIETRCVRCPNELEGLDGLILPGGESTTMSKFLDKNNFKSSLDSWREGKNGHRPIIWGTCAGLILLANKVKGMKQGGQLTLGGMEITADRNMYGRQNESFEATVRLTSDVIGSNGMGHDYKGVFIRAPGIASVDSTNVTVLAELVDPNTGDKRSVAAEENNLMVTAFHPELTEDFRWHLYFLKRVIQNVRNTSSS